MMIIGYLCAILVGVSLGVFGSGGSILTVPVMVYLMNVNPVDATGYSLFVVSITSAIGGATYVSNKMVNFKTAMIFGIPSIVCVFLTRKFILPAIPDVILSTTTLNLSKEVLIMLLFAVMMMLLAYNMIRKTEYNQATGDESPKYNYPRLIFIGLIVGLFTGMLGVGGGFIIIPALVLYANIPVRMSVGTSLLIISFNSFSGFTEEMLQRHAMMNYYLLALFTLLSVSGIFLGFQLSLKLNAAQLRKRFGWFMLLMGTSVFIKEIFFPFQ